jgi:adenosylhomocysteinase
LNSEIKDIKLAPQGKLKIDWVKEHMPVLRKIEEEFITTQPFKGEKVVICLHLEAKTAYLAKTIKSGGAEVTVCASNPLSTQDDVVASLVEDGISAFAGYGATDEEYTRHIQLALDSQPDLIIDDGGDLVHTLHTVRQELIPRIKGGAEETTTGILRLKALDQQNKLKFPMIGVNDAYCKYLFDNRYGTGQSVWDGIMRTTNLVVAGKNVVVIGYGWCGKGVAMRAKGLGANVIVTEVDAVKACEAVMDGFKVMELVDAAPIGDLYITVTGNKDVINKEHFAVMKDQAIMCNAGHFDCEISKTELDEITIEKRTVRHNIEEYKIKDGRKLYVLAEGRLVNLAAGDGHPAEIMDMTFALQALSLQYANENHQNLEPKLYNVSSEIDQRVAKLKLESLGIKIDTLSEEQKLYLAGWHV